MYPKAIKKLKREKNDRLSMITRWNFDEVHFKIRMYSWKKLCRPDHNRKTNLFVCSAIYIYIYLDSNISLLLNEILTNHLLWKRNECKKIPEVAYLCCVIFNSSFVTQIWFISHKQFVHIFASISVDFLQPLFDIVERFLKEI